MRSFYSSLPLEGMQASLGPGPRSVSGAKTGVGEMLSPGALCPMIAVALLSAIGAWRAGRCLAAIWSQDNHGKLRLPAPRH
jgi:hypothetical protein